MKSDSKMNGPEFGKGFFELGNRRDFPLVNLPPGTLPSFRTIDHPVGSGPSTSVPFQSFLLINGMALRD
jgi:hypothetical protein